VKISRGSRRCGKDFCGIAWISAENPVGTGSAEEFLEIRLTESAIRIEFAACSPDQTNNNRTTVNV
jgi:hypothetical protein